MKKENIPHCIGIIMDGNRRWARKQNLSLVEGHRRGAEKAKEVVRWAREAGVETIIFYTFSNENWSRAQEEVAHLMDIFRSHIRAWAEEIHAEGGRVRFIGDRSRFSQDLQKEMEWAETLTINNTGMRAVFAMSYGGRADIVQAVNTLLQSGKKEISEQDLADSLWTKGIPDPDLIIRTSGEQRLSGFLPWQSTYSELVFTNTYWPAFYKEEFLSILEEYAQRERRHGK